MPDPILYEFATLPEVDGHRTSDVFEFDIYGLWVTVCYCMLMLLSSPANVALYAILTSSIYSSTPSESWLNITSITSIILTPVKIVPDQILLELAALPEVASHVTSDVAEFTLHLAPLRALFFRSRAKFFSSHVWGRFEQLCFHYKA